MSKAALQSSIIIIVNGILMIAIKIDGIAMIILLVMVRRNLEGEHLGWKYDLLRVMLSSASLIRKM